MSATGPTVKPILKIEGPPGTGKSRELARETCRLIAGEGVEPAQILVLAMTRAGKRRLKAYLEAEARLAGLPEAPPVILHTLEEWLLTLVQRFDETAHIQPWRLLAEPDAQILLHGIVRSQIPADHPLAQASRQFSFSRALFELIRQLQLQGVDPEELQQMSTAGSDSRLPLLSAIYQQFQQHLHARKLLCYGDLARQAEKTVLNSDSTVREIARDVAAILVDDAQELSRQHHQLLSALAVDLVLAGHAQFSIRSYRGAQPEAFQSLDVYGERPVTLLPKMACLRNNEAILSLLNRFLPQPVWEAHELEPERLPEQVHFGFFADPMQEAQRLVSLIKRLKATEVVDDRPVDWQDCVVLLRSTQYRTHLINALLEAQVPFRSELLSEEIMHLQHALYDCLSVLCDWQVLPGSGAIAQRFANWQATSQEKLDWVQRGNRHLRRWLEAMLSGQEDGMNWDLLVDTEPENPQTVHSLLIRLEQAANLPPALQSLWALLQRMDAAHQTSGRLSQSLPLFLEAWKKLANGTASDWPAAWQAFLQNLTQLEDYYQSVLGKGLPLMEVLEHYVRLWDGLETVDSGESQVRLMSIHQMQGEEAPFVFVPFLMSEEFPHSREFPELLSEADLQATGLTLNTRLDEAEEARLLAVGMSRATRRVILSCHRMDAGQPVLPSAFYGTLLAQKQALLGNSSTSLVFCRCHAGSAVGLSTPCPVDYCLRPDAGLALVADDDRYAGQSRWASLPKAEPEPLFSSQESVTLSASSIKTYMTCPRQFYYRHLLRLPLPGSDEANLGTLVHRLMEVFNTQATPEVYTEARLKQLAEQMFLFQDDPVAFYEAGFGEKDMRMLDRLSPLSLEHLRTRLMESVADLARKGYFERYGQFKAVQPEKELQSIQLPGLERCRLTGQMDALIQLEDGRWEIVDYKTFRSAYGAAGLETCQRHFQATLDPLPEGEDLSHAERFAAKLSPTYPKDYQLPLYYLACNQDSALNGRLRGVALQVLRPAFAENPNQGAIRLEISGEGIEAVQGRLLDEMNRYIVQPILDSAAFEANPEACGRCGYFGICDVSGEESETVGEF